jgi:tRNA (guanine-N7-)-methyltransferase
MIDQGCLDYQTVFGRSADCYLEIGFGSGQSLLALAAAHPDCDYIGIETHKPGVGALLNGVLSQGLSNVRVFHEDAIDVLDKAIPAASLQGIQIFFPDPWQKRRHHARRLIQPDFISQVITKLKPAGWLHLATDWEDYAKHMLAVLTSEPKLTNVAGLNQYASRSTQRPIITKFERRALAAGRKVWELQFKLALTVP